MKIQLNDALDLLIRQKPLVYAYYVDETGDERQWEMRRWLLFIPGKLLTPWN